MNEIVQRMISTQFLLFLYMFCGVIASRIGIIQKDNRQPLVRLLMDIAMPMMVLSAFNKPTSMEQMKASIVIMTLAFVGCVINGLLGWLAFRKVPKEKRSALLYMSMFSNAGNAGLPIISLVFGSGGVFLASMYLIPPRILQWTVGISFFVKNKEKNAWVKNVLLNPMVVVVYIGLILMFTGWQIPGVFATAIDSLADMTAPLSMMLIGATLADMDLRMLIDKEILKMSFLRLIAFPLLFTLILTPLKLDRTTMNICIILLAMPAASNTASIAERYGGDYEFASACISVSTLLSVVTVPIITWMIQRFINA
ncbi:MAG: AEC family transporter [Christensenellales bacterium]|mgnify:CR=1 FL=1|jgi:predicted permease|nr:AEC family transporter [Clostridiales bacterium]